MTLSLEYTVKTDDQEEIELSITESSIEIEINTFGRVTMSHVVFDEIAKKIHSFRMAATSLKIEIN